MAARASADCLSALQNVQKMIQQKALSGGSVIHAFIASVLSLNGVDAYSDGFSRGRGEPLEFSVRALPLLDKALFQQPIGHHGGTQGNPLGIIDGIGDELCQLGNPQRLLRRRDALLRSASGLSSMFRISKAG